MSSVNQETGKEQKSRFYKVELGSRTKYISKRSPYPQKKLTKASYVSPLLLPGDAAYYSAAGVFAYRLTAKKKLEVLVGIEDQWDKRSMKPLPDRVNFLGGKREEEKDMSASNTAVREFWEESGGILSVASRARMSASMEAVLWYRPGKYAMFIHRLHPEDHDLPKKYNNLDSERKAELAEMKKLLWLPLCVDSSSQRLVFDVKGTFNTPHFLLAGILKCAELVKYVQDVILRCADDEESDAKVVRDLIGSLSLDD